MTYALKDDQHKKTHNINEILNVGERFYPRLYTSDVIPEETAEATSLTCDVNQVTKEEGERALKVIKAAKAAGDDGITVDLLKDGGDIVLEDSPYNFQNAWRLKKCP